MTIKMFNFLFKTARACKTWSQKDFLLSDHENFVLIAIYKLFAKI